MANRLSINIEKTNYSIFSPTRGHGSTSINYSQLKLYVNGKEISRANSVKYLGLTIDENLKFSDHIKLVHDKIIKYVGIFYKIRHKLPYQYLKGLYFATVYPHILYGVEIYANTHKSYLSDLIAYIHWN